MNFQHIGTIESSKVILDAAFRKARERSISKKLKGNWLEIIRKKELIKIDIIKESVVTKLFHILQSFPPEKDLSLFYKKLIALTLDYQEYKKSLGSLNWSIQKIKKFHRFYASKIVKTKTQPLIKSVNKEFYGRISSVVKQMEPYLQCLETSRKIMRTYPDLKEMFTVCIYGFPNVGKTTLLNALAGTHAYVADYAFTTRSINAGYSKINERDIQFLDVPGALGRPGKKNIIELQADLVLEEVADLVIYVFDFSEHCGYTLEQQKSLLNQIKEKKPLLIFAGRNSAVDDPSVISSPEVLLKAIAARVH